MFGLGDRAGPYQYHTDRRYRGHICLVVGDRAGP